MSALDNRARITSRPFVVDLDSTLLLKDSLHESALRALRRRSKINEALTFNLAHPIEAVQDIFHHETKPDA